MLVFLDMNFHVMIDALLQILNYNERGNEYRLHHTETRLLWVLN